MAVNMTAQSIAVGDNWTKVGNDYVGDNPTGDTGSDTQLMSLALSGAGRIGFYQDYSERSSVGTHTFYLQRTHGSSGAVSVTYTSSGDSHSIVTGSLSWADGQIGVKSVTVPVASKSDGEHRITLTLSNPTNGAVLHNGSHTVAYGVIDDGTIAADSDAVFYDSAAVTNGTGTQASPYNNIYDAISNVGSKRYLYGKGTTVPDGTNTANPNGGGGIVNCINFPATRTGEADRLIIRSWPANTWTVSGGGGNEEIGFYSAGGKNYITFKGIDFSALSAWSGVGSKFAEGGGISCFKTPSTGINVELCTFDNIDGSSNTSGFNPYKVTNAKVWRCTMNNIKVNGDNTSANASGVLTYEGINVSVQRCTVTNTHSGVYQKRVGTQRDVTLCASFNIFDTSHRGVLYSAAGTGGFAHSYSIVQSNVIKNCSTAGIEHNYPFATDITGECHHWANNVFENCGAGETAAILFQYAYRSAIFNNIMLNCRKVWADVVDRSADGSLDIEYADYNNEFGTTLTSQRYEYRGVNYSTAASLSGFGFAQNDTQTDPAFDLSYNTLLTGVGSVPQGVYLTANETIGAA